jgi:recombination protein RecA
MKKKPSPEMEDSRIVSVLKKMEEMKLRDSIQWMRGDGVVSDVTVTPSGILSLDIAMGIGGYPHGRIIEIYGENSSGKTTSTLQAIAEFQKRGGIAAFIDAEVSLDVAYAKSLGVDVDNLLISQPDSAEQSLEMAIALSSGLTKGDIIVLDSIAALTPQAELDGEMGDAFVGLQPRLVGQAMRKLKGSVAKSGVLMFCTNQVRTNIKISYGDNTETPGGKSLKHQASIRIEAKKGSQIKEGDTVIGHVLKLKVAKNKCAPPYRTAETEIRYGEGVPKALDLLILGMNSGIVEKSGAWLSYKGERIGQGKENAYKLLRDNPEMLASIERDIREQFGVKG